MDEAKLRTVAQLQEFLDATQEVTFTGAPGESDQQRYEHISRVLKRLAYTGLGKGDRGVVLAYLRCTSGYNRSQVTLLVGRWESNRLATVPLAKRYSRPTVPFARKYNSADIELLVEMDRANDDVCGPAIVHLLQRAFCVYGDQRYERLSKLSVSHLYNLRKSGGYSLNPAFSSEIRHALNRGESSHTLQHAIHSGKIPAALSKRTESLVAVSSALSLLSNCVMSWNAAHMQTALDGIKQAGAQPVTHDLRRIAPTNIEGVNLRGTFDFPVERFAQRILPSSVNTKDLSRRRMA